MPAKPKPVPPRPPGNVRRVPTGPTNLGPIIAVTAAASSLIGLALLIAAIWQRCG